MLSVIILNVIVTTVINPSVAMLSVMAPFSSVT